MQNPKCKIILNTSFSYAFSVIGISPPRGSHGAALFGCDGLFTLDL